MGVETIGTDIEVSVAQQVTLNFSSPTYGALLLS